MVNKRQILLIFCVFSLLGFLLYSHEWNSEFHWDDYHLMRSFSHRDLVRVWSGTWDPDHVETAGYRPLTTYFNHFRYKLFAENVHAHRLFLVLLNSLMLVVFLLVMENAGWSWPAGSLAGLLCIVSPSNFYHIAWISDGVHLFATLLGLLGILFALKAGRTGRFSWYFPLAHLFGLMGLLTREENIALYLISLIGPFFFTRLGRPFWKHVRSPLSYNLLVGMIFLGAFLLMRRAFIPDAINPLVGAAALPAIAHNFFKSLVESVNLLALVNIPLLTISLLALTAITAYGIFLGREGETKGLLFTFFSLGLCLLPSSLLYRTNLLLNPSIFSMAMISFAVVMIFNHVSGTMKVLGVVALISIMGMMARENYLYQENMHPLSLIHVHRKGEMLFYWKNATIPPARREKALSELAAVGLLKTPNPSWDEFHRVFVHHILESGPPPRRPSAGKLFRPLRENFYR